jgi:hypothetical protein
MIFFFCRRLRMFFRKIRRVVKMLVTCLVSKCEMWSRNATSDFSSCRKYLCEFVLVIMLDHLIVYVSTVRLEFFRDDERDLIRFFEMTGTWRSDSSSLTKATHQTWRERLIKLDRQHLVKSDELYLIKSDEEHLIKPDGWYLIKLDGWYLIKLDRWYLIKLDEDFVCSLR